MESSRKLELGLISALVLLVTFAAGQIVAANGVVERYRTPHYMSIQTEDFMFGERLYREAKQNGECVKYVKLPEPRKWWLHSC